MSRLSTERGKVTSTGQLHYLPFPLVGDHLVRVLSDFQPSAMALPDEDDVKSARRQHTGKSAFSGIDCELALRVIPVKRDRRVDALLVVVVVVLVLIQREATVGAGVNAQLNRIGRLLVGVLKERTHRNNGPGPDHQRDLVDGGIGGNAAAAGERLSGPEIDPRIPGR